MPTNATESHADGLSIKTLQQRLASMRSMRSQVESLYDDIARFMLDRPPSMTAGSRSASSTRGQTPKDVFTKHGVNANMRLASGLQGLVAPPEQRWLSLQVSSTAVNDVYAVRRYLDDIEEVLYSVFSSSGFYHKSLEMMTEYTAFGQGVMMVTYDPVDKVQFIAIPVRECYFDMDIQGRINTVCRVHAVPIRSIPARFPDVMDVPEFAQKYHRDPEAMVELQHYVLPNPRYVPGSRSPKERRYNSVYILAEGGPLELTLERHFYDSMPYLTPRWQVLPGEVYGRSQAMVALSEVRMLSQLVNSTNSGLDMLLRPPLLGMEGIVNGNGINYNPGGITTLNSIAGNSVDGGIRPLNTGARPDIGLQAQEGVKQGISYTMMSDMLAEAKDERMSATEASTRQMLRIASMAPQIGRVIPEYLDPLIERVLDILVANNLLPKPPEAINGLAIEYRSPLAKAQRLQAMDGVNMFMQSFQMLAQSDPTGGVMDLIDMERLVQFIALATDAPAAILRSPEEIAQIKQQRAEAEAQAQQQQMAQQGSETALNAARALQAVDSTSTEVA